MGIGIEPRMVNFIGSLIKFDLMPGFASGAKQAAEKLGVSDEIGGSIPLAYYPNWISASGFYRQLTLLPREIGKPLPTYQS